MTARFILSPEAQRDIEQIRDYYVDEAGVQVARHVLGQITKALSFPWRNAGRRTSAQ